MNLIRQIPEEPYEKFDFITTQLDDVVFGLKHAGTGQLINAFILSDGTLRTLAVLTALETVAEGSLVIIEEFDNGLHPSRLDILVKAIDECSRRRKLNVLVTTHNPATLNALEAEQLDGVVFCTWNKEKQTSELIKLYDIPRWDELLEKGQLGNLVTRRVVERYLAPNFEENRQKRASELLESLP
ncbi:MAG: ATP-binding protein [Desulfobacteraceae bacterium]|nr:ATP-binding protein [Desulfobacteraceae bacterium]